MRRNRWKITSASVKALTATSCRFLGKFLFDCLGGFASVVINNEIAPRECNFYISLLGQGRGFCLVYFENWYSLCVWNCSPPPEKSVLAVNWVYCCYNRWVGWRILEDSRQFFAYIEDSNRCNYWVKMHRARHVV